MNRPDYKKIDAEAEQAYKEAAKNAAKNGWTGWDCTNAGLEAQKKVWRKYGVDSPRYRETLPQDGLDKLNLDSLDD